MSKLNPYQIIYNELKQAIENKIYKPNDRLPSENQLAKTYKVSRETIRKVLKLLATDGYIQKQQGKCSIVLDHKQFEFPVSNLTSYAELDNHQHLHSKTNVEQLRKDISQIENPMYPFKDQEVWQSIRTREIDGEKIILDKDYLNPEIIPHLTPEILEKSLFDYVENELGLVIDYSIKEITVENVTEEDKKYLDLSPADQCVVVVRSQAFLKDTQLFEYTESRHRADKFIFKEFSRRKKGM